MRGLMRGLVADLGGTNARFAVAAIDAEGGVTLTDPVSLTARDYAKAEDAVDAYLHRVGGGEAFDFAAMACAGPVQSGQVFLTNLGWTLSEAHLGATLGLHDVHLLNDLAAAAWAAPALGDGDLRPIGPKPGGREVIAVFGAGTGTNCAAFVAGQGTRSVVLAGEGGHASFAPADEREVEIWRRLKARFGRVSVERLASGPGMLNIYQALCEIGGVDAACTAPEGVSTLAEQGDAVAVEALDRFALILGAIAGDFALTFGAEALYIAGGLAPHLLIGERASLFRSRFDDKGRFTTYMHEIGAAVIVHPHAALIGAARAASALQRSA